MRVFTALEAGDLAKTRMLVLTLLGNVVILPELLLGLLE
jgi:hypothetical protein